MESQCEYYMYFPAVPISDLSDPARYRSLPRRSHLYLGETVRFLLVLRCRDGDGDGTGDAPRVRIWKELAGNLSAVASVSPGDSRQPPHYDYPGGGDEPGLQGADEQTDDEEEAATACRTRGFRDCKPLLIHNSSRPLPLQSPLDEPVVLSDEVIFPLTVSLDKLPVGTVKVKIIVTVWKRDMEKAEVQEHGYLTILQNCSPSLTFREDLNTFKAQVSTTLTVLPPPTVKCQQMTVSGKYLTILKVLNTSSQEEISIRDVKILPNFNACYLPMMPDGSVLLVDNVCHQSGDVAMASFYRVDSLSSGLPTTLSALEEHNFLFKLQVNERPQEDVKEGLEVPLVAVLQWSTPKLPFTNFIYTHYRLPSVRLDRPRFVMMASCESPVAVRQRFQVQYTLLNNLQDFLAVRLVWTPESAITGKLHSQEESRASEAALNAVVCHTPLSNLGYCRKGSTLTFNVAFQILRAGLFELSQHMKLKLQFTASVSNPPPEARPLSRKNSPSSPAVRDLMERHQASLGRSQSFSHQQPSRSHLMRTGSVMERRAITPPVSSPIGRPLYHPPEKAVLSLDKIAKRECKVLVVDPVK
ncbi:trafficking protein particle complex subunit 14 [Erpetoichthys calabaricus]|uniref:Trafficking protein particle complex subunit 14 n=1 Tax=Erpetoichthys calabaricus TaxID=27687 RepID=A0A8C4S089_ERPCA|nr:trafficking protein particle complex subunit 14 [Erpetoichthys calabaricus]XP_039603166.1 trafficking protein particle complex subunit 14 [Polypterus senegalus]